MSKQKTKCVAYGCNKRKRSVKDSSYVRSDSEGSEDEESAEKRKFPRTFHRFPKDPEKKSQWVANIRLKDWEPSIYSQICSDHFGEEHMDRTGQIIRLREGAIPTRFKKFPSYLKKVRKKRNPPRERLFSPDLAKKNVTHEDGAMSPPVRKSCLERVEIEHTYQLTLSPRKLKRQLDKTREQMTRLKRKLKTSQQKTRRLQLKVQSLNSTVQCLKKSELISPSCGQVLNQAFSVVPLAVMKMVPSEKGVEYRPFFEISDHPQLSTENSESNTEV